MNTWDFEPSESVTGAPTRRQRLVRRAAIVFGGLTMGGAALAIALGGSGSTPAPAHHATLVAAGSGSLIGYQVIVDSGTGCTTTQTANGIYAVPTLIGIGGHIVPDLLVTVLPVPAVPPLTNSTFAQVNVTRLGAAMPLRVRVVLSPSGPSDPSRVALGYDGCDNTAPKGFTATVNENDSDLNIAVQTNGAGPDLTVQGETYTDAGGAVTNPTSVTAALAPVPSKLTADVKILGSGNYAATVTSTSPTKLGLTYVNQTPTTSTTAQVGLTNLPSSAAVNFSSTGASYSASAPIGDATLNLTTTAAGQQSQLITAHLVNLPTSATLTRSGATSASLSTPGTIGDATVRFASFNPGTTLPAVPTDVNQHLDAIVRPDLTLADLELRGVGSSNVSFDDPITIHAQHTAGPFDLSVADSPATGASTTVTGSVDDLPATVDLSYAKATQAVQYTGSAVIGSLNVSLHSSEPFASRATDATLSATNVPTGLSTTLDSTNKTFAASTTGTPLGQIRLKLTNGLDNPVQAGDGLYLFDNVPSDPAPPVDTPYEVSVQVSQLTSVSVGWGSPIAVNIVHAPGSFFVDASIAQAKDTSVQHLHITGFLDTLPATANVQYFSPGDGPSGQTASFLSYTASDRMPELTLDVSSDLELIDGTGATQAHLDLTDLPSTLTANIDTTNKQFTADVPSGAGLGGLTARVTSGPLEDAGSGDRVVFQQRIAPDPNPSYLAFAHLSGISHVAAAWGDTTHLTLTHTPGPLAIDVLHQSMEPDDNQNQVLNTQTINANIANLPATVDLTYQSTNGTTINYTGSDPISEVDVEGTSSPLFFQGRGNNLHARLVGLPTGLNLSMNFGDSADQFSADTGGAQIGLLELSIDNGVDDRGLLNGNDGVLMEDMTVPADADPAPVTPDTTPYQLFARATGLQSIDYTSSDPEVLVPTDGRQISAFASQHHIDAVLNGGHDVEFLQRSYGGLIEGDNPVQPKKEGFTYLQGVFHAPPASVHLDINQQTLVDGDDWKTTVDYHTDSASRPDGSTLDFATNSGKNVSRLEATVTPVPAHAFACISPDRRVCVNHDNFPDGFNSDGTNVDDITGGTSYDIEVSQPVQMTIFECTEDLRIHSDHNIASDDVALENDCAEPIPTGVFSYEAHKTEGTLNISSKVALMSATNESCFPDCGIINIDTDSTPVQGRIVQSSVHFNASVPNDNQYSNDLHLEFPTGFEADDRIVQIGCGVTGCSGDPVHGRVACPPGTRFVKPVVFGLDANFAEEFCDKAVITDVSPSTLTRGESTQVELAGRGFSPGEIISLHPDNFVGPALQISNVQFIDFDHVTFDVTVPDDASINGYTLDLVNDNDISDTIVPGLIQVTGN